MVVERTVDDDRTAVIELMEEDQGVTELIEMAAAKREYSYVISEVKQPEEVFDEVTAALDCLINMASRSRQQLTGIALSRLVEMLRGHMIHVCPDVAKLYVPGEAIVFSHLRHLPTLTRVYCLFQTMMPEIVDYVTEEFLRDLISLLNTSSQAEQELIFTALCGIAKHEPDLQPLVLKSMLNLIGKYREGYESAYAISPALQYLAGFFGGLQPMELSSYFGIFRSLIYPLVTSHDCVQFYVKFRQLAELFYIKDSTTAVWCIRYLFRHWPLTDTGKQVVFLHQVQCLMCSLSASYLPTLGEAFCAKLRLCFASDNFRVAQASIEIFKDEAFTSTYLQCCEKAVLSLIPVLDRTATEHWNADVRKVAVDVGNAIRQASGKKSLCFGMDQATRAQQGWQAVAGLASANRSDGLNGLVSHSWPLESDSVGSEYR
jgi:hypothetical protein